MKKGKGCLTVIGVLIVLGIIGGMLNDKNTEKEAQKNLATQSEETSVSKSNETTEENKDIVKSGQYKVGQDIKAGEYKVFSENNSVAYIESSKDSTGNMDSIIFNDNIQNTSYIIVNDGNYLKLTGCYAIPVEKAKKFEGDKITSGMYKVGVDIPRGEYKVISDGNASYFEVNTKPHDINAIVTNENFSDSRFITVSDGQYLKLSNCTAEKVK